jgi:hypothetical protein
LSYLRLYKFPHIYSNFFGAAGTLGSILQKYALSAQRPVVPEENGGLVPAMHVGSQLILFEPHDERATANAGFELLRCHHTLHGKA